MGWKSLVNRLKDAGKKAYKAATGKDMPTTPYYGRITSPTMIDRPLFTPKAAPPPPPKKKKKGLWDTFTDNVRSAGRSIDRAVTQPIVNQVKQAGTAIDKKVIQPVSTSKTMKSIQKAAQKGADSAGDVLQGRKDIYGNDINRQAKSKVENTTPLVDDGSAQQKAAREMEAEIARGKMMSEATRRNQGMIDGRIDAGFEGDIAAGRARPMVNSETENKIANTIIDGLSRILPGKETASTNSGTSLPQEGVLVAGEGNSGWQAYPSKQNKTPLERLIENSKAGQVLGDAANTVVEGISEGVDTVKEAAGSAWDAIRPDKLETRVFNQRFVSTGWATQDEYRRFKQAEYDGDFATMSQIKSTVEARQKAGIKPQ